MIERIAQTIFCSEHPGAIKPVAVAEREVALARDILMAMREPTDEMVDEGTRADLPSDAEVVWLRMIDTALGEVGL
jgi:hypothetical protein